MDACEERKLLIDNVKASEVVFANFGTPPLTRYSFAKNRGGGAPILFIVMAASVGGHDGCRVVI